MKLSNFARQSAFIVPFPRHKLLIVSGQLFVVSGQWSGKRQKVIGNKYKYSLCPQFPVPSPQSPVPSPQSPVPSPQSPVPSPQSPNVGR
ncbi:hypothetical protein [Anabaena sp. UHCC 0187]|uniref:hypothetical protein n=1 Tax=Anabaena sp. UHCC 0187 TaxID=2590018 RepID=UPI00144742E5|nr:hypothetical protein [Anabaena sp. UHCC 0187]